MTLLVSIVSTWAVPLTHLKHKSLLRDSVQRFVSLASSFASDSHPLRSMTDCAELQPNIS